MGLASHRYIKDLVDARKHVDYIAYRQREGKDEEYGLFNEHDNKANVEEFKALLKDKKTQHSKVAVAHTILFSMSQDEWDRSGFKAEDYKTLIRNTLKQWELEKGYRLKWAASVHMNEGHPHCHAIIKAVYTDRDAIQHRLKINDEDRKFFGEQFDKEKTALRGFELPSREERMQEKQHPHNKGFALDFIDQMLYQAQRQLEQEQYEREQERTHSR